MILFHPGHHGDNMSVSFTLTPLALGIILGVLALAYLVTRRGSRR